MAGISWTHKDLVIAMSRFSDETMLAEELVRERKEHKHTRESLRKSESSLRDTRRRLSRKLSAVPNGEASKYVAQD